MSSRYLDPMSPRVPKHCGEEARLSMLEFEEREKRNLFRPLPYKDSMPSRNQQFDFDFIVIGSGFGGSVSAHRLAEKGYRGAVVGVGRGRAAGHLAHTNWV